MTDDGGTVSAAIGGGSAAGLAVTVLSDPQVLHDLRAEWLDLLGRSPRWSAAHTPDYVIQGWEIAAHDPGRRLAVVVVRRDGKLVCLWPLQVRRQGWRTVGVHLGNGSREEYAGPLVAQGEGVETVHAALAAARKAADVLTVYGVPEGSLAEEALRSPGGMMRSWPVRSPVTSLSGALDWDSWAAKAVSKRLRTHLRYDRKRLTELGDLRFRRMAGAQDGPRCVNWIFERKREWLAGRPRGHRSWMHSPEGPKFFNSFASRPAADTVYGDPVEAYALTLDDRILAACICFTSSDRVEYFTTAYDPEFGAYGPGTLIIQDCIAIAIGRRLDFDFRITQDAYKQRWVDRYDVYQSFIIAGSPRGAVAVAVDIVQDVVHRFRMVVGPRAKAWLKRVRRPA